MTPVSQQRPQPPEEHPTVFYALVAQVASLAMRVSVRLK